MMLLLLMMMTTMETAVPDTPTKRDIQWINKRAD
jgi:hypothetical protein